MTIGGCETGGPFLTGVLARALRDGTASLPDDLHQLHADLKLVGELLAEKALEHEPTWTLAKVSAAEIEALQKLERIVALKVSETGAEGLPDILAKLAIWELLVSGSDGGDDNSVSHRLVRSVRRDLEAMLRGEAVREIPASA